MSDDVSFRAACEMTVDDKVSRLAESVLTSDPSGTDFVLLMSDATGVGVGRNTCRVRAWLMLDGWCLASVQSWLGQWRRIVYAPIRADRLLVRCHPIIQTTR